MALREGFAQNLKIRKGIPIRKSVGCLIASYAILGDMYILSNDGDFDQIAKGSELKIYKSWQQ